jgi:hypothetical protein
MKLLTIPERIQLLQNLLDDPFDNVSQEILRLADEHENVKLVKDESNPPPFKPK